MIKYEDLRDGDVVTAKVGANTITGPIEVSRLSHTPYFVSGYGNIYFDESDLISVNRELPSEPGEIISATPKDGGEEMYFVLDMYGNWHVSVNLIPPHEIQAVFNWEEV